MKSRSKAFATLTAVGLLVLTAALLAGAVLVSQQILLEQSRSEAFVSTRSKTWAVVQTLLLDLQKSWNADEQTLDLWWASHSGAFPAGTVLVSLSGRLNLNSITPFLIQNTELNATLLGKSVEDFTDYRTNKGPMITIADYKDYFQPAALNQLYTTYSVFSVNTADEIILEKILALRTGSEAFASTVRASLRQFRTNRQTLAPADWQTLVGAESDAVGDLMSTDPELDVNTASQTVLQAVLRDPDFKLDQPDAKLQLILSGRASQPWTGTTLMQALGLTNKAPLLAYLGTRCRFIQGEVPQESSLLTFVALATYSTDSPPKITFRILDTRWTSS
jgi:hypothetical protein